VGGTDDDIEEFCHLDLESLGTDEDKVRLKLQAYLKQFSDADDLDVLRLEGRLVSLWRKRVSCNYCHCDNV